MFSKKDIKRPWSKLACIIFITPSRELARDYTLPHLFLEQALEVNALGALNGGTEGAVPHKLGKGSQGTADTESDGVVQGLLEAVVVEEDTGGGVNVGVGVLGLEWMLATSHKWHLN